MHYNNNKPLMLLMRSVVCSFKNLSFMFFLWCWLLSCCIIIPQYGHNGLTMRKTLDRIAIYRRIYKGYTKESSMVSAPSWALANLIATMVIYAIHKVTFNSEPGVFLWACYIAAFATVSFMTMRFFYISELISRLQ